MKYLQIVTTSSVLSFFFFFFLLNTEEKNTEYISLDKTAINQTVLLPIEVLGVEGTTAQRTFDLTAAQASNAQKVWLFVNNLSYQNKGSVQINGGSWLTLNHSTAAVHPKELAYGGMVHGGFNTIRLTIPATGLIAGSNTIRFRFDTSDGISMGFRVIKMNLLDSGDNKLLPESTFIDDNPANWTAPAGSSVSNGRNLWYNKNLWNHYNLNNGTGFWYGQSIPNRRTMRAKCADCHTQDGRDLEMFSYSNLSIIERSKFHGMTEQEGKDIAAYIRSLSSNPKIGRYGRPWNPPYQPGPNIKNRPIEQWAAGAGLEWVLEKDADMAPYIFPNGMSKEAVRSVFDSDKMEDRTIIPLSIQFPDWKHWLPIIHPKDAYNKNGWWDNLSDAQNPVKSYEWVRNEFLNNYNPANIKSFNVPQKFRQLGKGVDTRSGFRHFYEIGSSETKHWRSKGGDANANLSDGIDLEMAKTSMARLMAVKNFEIAVEFDLQDKAPETVPNPALDDPAVRQWPSNWYNVFEVPAHFTSDNSRHYKNQEQRTSHYETTAWYNVQFVINGGNGFVGGTTPTDFNYHTPFIGFSNYYSGIDEPMRRFSAINQMYQIRTWSKSQNPGGQGFRIMNQGIWEMMGVSGSNQEFHSPFYDIVKQLDNIDPGLSDKVLEAMILQFLDEVESLDLSTWPREANGGGDYKLDSASKTTSQLITIPHNGTPGNTRITNRPADKLYDLIPIIQNNFGVHCSITNRLITWCKAAWPLIDFEKYTTANCPDEDCELPEIVNNGVYNIQTTHDKCIEAVTANGYSITQQTCAGNDTAKWLLENADTGYYYIKNLATGNYMTITGTTNGTPVEEAAFIGDDTQQWQINEANNCDFNIIAKGINKCLDLKSGNSADGTHFQLWDCVNTSSQNREYSFLFLDQIVDPVISITKTNDAVEGTSNASFTVSLDQGSNNTGSPITGTIAYTGSATQGADYTQVTSFSIPVGSSSTSISITVTDDTEVEADETIIATISNPSLGVVSANNAATATIVDNDCESTQIVANGVYRITTLNDKCFSSIDFDGHTVTQQTCDANDDKKWILQDAGSGYYFIKNRLTGNYLQAMGITGGSLVEEFAFSGNDDQQWQIIEMADCKFRIDAKTSGLAIDLRRGESQDGNWFQLYAYSDGGHPNKEFSFELLEMDQSVSISIAATQDGAEGTSDAVFTVSIDGGGTNDTGNPITGTISYTGSATQDSDYTSITSFNIPVGQNSTTISISIADDTEVESTETIVATIANPSEGSITNSTATANITDNDVAPNEIILSIETVTNGEEGTSDATFGIAIEGGLTNDTGADITGTITLAGTATSGTDYTAVTTFTIAPDENGTQITLPIVDDTDFEGEETIIATLATTTEGTIGSTNETTATITDNDSAPVYNIHINKALDGTEGGLQAIFDVSLDPNVLNTSGSPISGSITYTGTATPGDDFTEITSFNIPIGENYTSIVLPITDDNSFEGEETIIATISNASLGTIITNTATATITDNDPEPNTIVLAIQTVTNGSEGISDATFEISIEGGLTNDTGADITGNITLTGTATAGADYTEITSFAIAPNQNATQITLPIVDDSAYEGEETIIATLATSNAGTIGTTNTAEATITDNDPVPNEIILSVRTLGNGTEGSSDASFEVTIDGGLTNDTGSDITGTLTFAGTATSGVDYTQVTSFAIAPNQNGVQITIPVIDDTLVEDNETIIVTLSNASSGSIGANGATTAYIISNDCSSTQILANGIYNIKTLNDKCFSAIDFDGHTVTQQTCDANDDKKWILQDAGAGYYYIKNALTDNYLQAMGTVDGSLVEEMTFTGNDNQQWQIIELPNCKFRIDAKTADLSIDLRRGESNDGNWLQLFKYIDDQNAVNKQFDFDFIEMDDPISISIAKEEDGVEGSADAIFTISIDNGGINYSGNSIFGNIAYTGTAASNVDYTSVTSFEIPVGQSSVVINLPITDDTEVEDIETIIATLTNLNQGVPTNPSATATITDNDSNPVYDISISKTTDAIEGSTDASFTVSIDGNIVNTSGNAITGTITLTGTATQGLDYTAVSTFSIADGASSTIVTIPVLDDTDVEGPETITATISNLNQGNISNSAATATITDNDTPNEIVLAIQTITDGVEGNSDVSFEISIEGGLTNDTGADITGTIAFAGTATPNADYVENTTFVIPVNGTSTQITLPVLDDSEVEDMETIIATLETVSAGTIGTNNSANATITDNDVAQVYNLSITKVLDGVEGGFDAIFNVSLDPNVFNTSGNPINGTVLLSGTATADEDYTNVSSFSIPVGQNYTSIQIPIIDDTEVEDTETIIATIVQPSLGTIVNDTATATITDNDVAPNEIVLAIQTIADGAEGSSDVSFEISIEDGLTNDTGADITGTIAFAGTATPNTDYIENTTFVIPANGTSTQITLPVLNDTEVEDMETIIATLVSASTGTIGTNNSATATIADNDVAPNEIVLAIQTITDGTEGNSDVSFEISIEGGLTNDTGADITGTIVFAGTATPNADYVENTTFVIPANGTFTRITLPTIDDTEVEETETIVATIATSSAGTIGTINSATASIIDNDVIDVMTISIEGTADATEGEGDVEFTISIDGGEINNTGAPITGIISYGGTATPDADYIQVAAFEIPVGENETIVTLPVQDDNEAEDTETITAIISELSDGITGNNTATVSIFDEDIAIDGLVIYPNPSDSVINIIIPDSDNGYDSNVQPQLRVYDYVGKLLKVINTDEPLVTIDISDLPRGNYFIQLRKNKDTLYEFFTKN